MQKKTFLIIFIIIVLIIAGGFYFYYEKLTSQEELGGEEQISPEEEEFNNSGRAKAILEETDLWKVYEDNEVGVAIKYPGDVNFNNEDNDGLYTLSVNTQKIEEIEGTMGFNPETAKENQEALAKGEYGTEVDWPTKESKQITKIAEDTNAQDFLVLSRFEVCDVTFRRMIYFFHNDYQVVVSFSGPKDLFVASAPEYFTINEQNCGQDLIWDFDKQGDFALALKSGEGNPTIQEWYDLFDQIIDTIEFTDVKSFDLSLLNGKWQATDDAKSIIEFTKDKKIDYYDGEQLAESVFEVSGDHLLVSDKVGVFEYQIYELSDDELTLMYIPRGNILEYEKIK